MYYSQVINNKVDKISRYFRRNEGTTDYISIPAVTLAGDFEISGEFSTTDATKTSTFIGGATITVSEAIVDILSNGTVRFVVYDSSGSFVGLVTSSTGFNDGLLHTFNARMVGTTAELLVDGVSVGTSNFSLYDGVSLSNLYRRSDDTNLLTGILANLKIYDNGTLTRDYPLNEPKGTSTIYDLAGGNNGTIINGDDEDNGLFTQQANGDWKGSGLEVPPWDSVDQTLPVA